MLAGLRTLASSTAAAFSDALQPAPRAPKPSDVLGTANAVLDAVRDSGGTANLIRLQRLVGLAQFWNIALQGRPMFHASMTVVNGKPVLMELHSAFRRFGWHPILGRAGFRELPGFDHPSDQDEDRLTVIRSVVSAYARFDDHRLGEILADLLEGAVVDGEIDQKKVAQRLQDRITD